MKVAIAGCGAVGLYYGIKLALSGVETVFILRSGMEDARHNGLRIIQESGAELRLTDARFVSKPEEAGPADWVIIALKTTADEDLCRLVHPLLAPNTRLLTLQNGLNREEFLASEFPGHPVYGGLCFVCLNRIAPACVRHIGHGELALGAYVRSLPPSERSSPCAALEELCDRWRSVGVAARLITNLREARWRKLVWNVPFNGLSVVYGGIGVDVILANPAHLARCRALMEEICRIASAEGIIIGPEFLEEQIAKTRSMGGYLPSSAVDFLAGRPIEFDAIWFQPLREAARAGLPTRHLDDLVLQLRTLNEQRKRSRC